MNWRKTAIMGLLFIVVAFAFWFFEVKQKGERQKVKAEESRLLSGVSRIKRFRIETRSDIVEVAQDSATKQWQLVAPVFYPADNDEVQKVLKAALEAHYTDVVVDSGNPAEYGLAPVPWVRFTSEGKTFLLGEETPTKSGVYAQIEGNPEILLVPEKYRRELLKVSFDLRDKSILPSVDISEVDSAVFERDDGAVKFVRRGFQWWLTSPIEAEADNQIVENAIKTTMNAKAAEFAAEDHSDSTLKRLRAKPSCRAKFFTKSGTMLQMQFFFQPREKDTVPEFTFAYTPEKKPLFEVSQHIWQLIRKPVDYFRNHSLAKVTEADSFVVKGPSGFTLAVRRDGEGWRLTKPDTAKADRDQVNRFLRNVQYSRIDSFRSDNRFNPSGWKFEFYTADERNTYIIGDTTGNMVQLKEPGKREYYLVRKTNILKWCKPDWERFVSRRILDIDANKVQRMSITVDGDRYVFSRGEPKWKVKTPQGGGSAPFYRVRSAMDGILKLKYTNTYPDTVKWDEANAKLRADIVDSEGSSYYIAIGELEGGEKIAAVSGRTTYYAVPGGCINSIKRKLERVMEKR